MLCREDYRTGIQAVRDAVVGLCNDEGTMKVRKGRADSGAGKPVREKRNQRYW